jgi:translation elongation factor EF-G
MSQGRASNTMEFLEYRPMPANLVKAIKEGTEGKAKA